MKTLALNILDIVQNSIRARADLISVDIREYISSDLYEIKITDNGSGIPDEMIGTVTDPFVTTRTRRRMGLGLSLLKFHAGIAGGSMKISSRQGVGTEVTASMSYSHLDRQPLGDMTGVLMMLIASNPGTEFCYSHSTDKGSYSFSTALAKVYLGISDLGEKLLLDDLREMTNENLRNIEASGLQFDTAL